MRGSIEPLGVTLAETLAEKLGCTPLDVQREAMAVVSSRLYRALVDHHKETNSYLSIHSSTIEEREGYRAAVRGIDSFSTDLITLGNNHG